MLQHDAAGSMIVTLEKNSITPATEVGAGVGVGVFFFYKQ